MALMAPNSTKERIHVVFPEHVLSADPEYIEAVRFFSFLIGEEAIDFEQVKNMACNNRGYMVHVQNMADVEDKVQIGGRSYFFMLDQNGFIMFHPQLRPIDPFTKSHKQNYNNMDLLELEVPQTQQVTVRKMVMDCDNSDPQQLDILYATEMLDRVYPQTNSYYSECIKGANFVRYCLLNDTDTNITKEEAFVIYANQMRHSGRSRPSLLSRDRFQFYPIYSGKLPDLCRPREQLVKKLLVDLEATSALQDSWDLQWQYLKDMAVDHQ
ncbi:hypothetical protein ANCCEY_05839 [Ancylostoma ceylanicum]|uniref:Uncharacterized protein n=1 Tax=Ancylostoma ceylanicum TaxID=53326 RepID=A0A0D6LT63_9BILA|nr:hypothetical protein ANCCEY_05839 [Ancylostoma ceylanicum]